MEHLAYEFDAGGFVGVLFFEVHDESESAVFEGGVRGTDYYCVPVYTSAMVSAVLLLWERGEWDSVGRNGYQVITLSAIGLALTPAGGSVCMRLKSRISLRRAAVDMLLSRALQQVQLSNCDSAQDVDVC